MAPQIDAEGLNDALPAGVPAVFINSHASAGRPAFRIDNAAGMDAVVRHLAEGGRRRFAHVAGPAGNIDARERLDGFTAAVARYAPGVAPVVVEGDFREASGEAAVAQIRARGVEVDAIVAANDMMALGVLSALREAGVDVPGAVAVTGFDDVPLARYLGLSTVGIRVTEMGALAVARLIDALDGAPLTNDTQIIATQLVVRSTTGSPT
jgi:LacI family transcriptional regulator